MKEKTNVVPRSGMVIAKSPLPSVTTAPVGAFQQYVYAR